MGSRWGTVVVDALDPTRLGRWWAEVLDYRLLYEAVNEVVIGTVAAGQEHGPRLLFTRLPDARTGKNRLHLELHPDDQDAEVERLLDMGARHVEATPDGHTRRVVLADPEGNEFFVLPG
jgi:catechol 2,3-dioxygenase-like lactoylglutathione lyase family enzyme